MNCRSPRNPDAASKWRRIRRTAWFKVWLGSVSGLGLLAALAPSGPLPAELKDWTAGALLVLAVSCFAASVSLLGVPLFLESEEDPPR